ncbi:MAG: hypothetical protein DWH81_02470 [Planctomycetota bacterium]|nr:MAG: hypothetical protein DWH81_02470 [Planctomycetota bacterium]
MFVLWVILAGLLVLMLGLSIRLRRGLRGTTLTTTANWSIFTAAIWTAAGTLSAFVFAHNSEVQDQLWYWTAVVSVIPPIAVLGAKRPGSEAWNFFVLLPLVFVLGWPALTVWTSHGPDALRVETPVLIGFVLVLVMGCGNYIATRLALPALLYALAVVLVLAPCSTVSAGLGISFEAFRLSGTISMLLATLWSGLILTYRPETTSGPDRVWNDFRETFGIVWTKRAMDRINIEFATREQWPAQLGPDGLEWPTPPTDQQREHVEARMVYALHWLLRRFVDPDWIDHRLVSPAGLTEGLNHGGTKDTKEEHQS